MKYRFHDTWSYVYRLYYKCFGVLIKTKFTAEILVGFYTQFVILYGRSYAIIFHILISHGENVTARSHHSQRLCKRRSQLRKSIRIHDCVNFTFAHARAQSYVHTSIAISLGTNQKAKIIIVVRRLDFWNVYTGEQMHFLNRKLCFNLRTRRNRYNAWITAGRDVCTNII
jgi:hypothetical protein